MNKYIFLDIDGVLATDVQMEQNFRHEEWNCYGFDKKCVKILNEVLEKTNAIIILSSDWKHHYDHDVLNLIFKWNGIITPIDAVTDDLWGVKYFSLNDLEACRADEIKKFVKENGIQHWIAIDDLDLSPYLDEENFVHTPRPREGMKQSGVKDKILKRLL